MAVVRPPDVVRAGADFRPVFSGILRGELPPEQIANGLGVIADELAKTPPYVLVNRRAKTLPAMLRAGERIPTIFDEVADAERGARALTPSRQAELHEIVRGRLDDELMFGINGVGVDRGKTVYGSVQFNEDRYRNPGIELYGNAALRLTQDVIPRTTIAGTDTHFLRRSVPPRDAATAIGDWDRLPEVTLERMVTHDGAIAREHLYSLRVPDDFRRVVRRYADTNFHNPRTIDSFIEAQVRAPKVSEIAEIRLARSVSPDLADEIAAAAAPHGIPVVT